MWAGAARAYGWSDVEQGRPVAQNRKTDGAAQPTRRELFVLAAALTGTVLTGGIAIAGLTRAPRAPSPSATPAPQVQAPIPQVEPGD
jgi:hypothetical protein